MLTEYAINLRDDQLYALMTALRGPDIHVPYNDADAAELALGRIKGDIISSLRWIAFGGAWGSDSEWSPERTALLPGLVDSAENWPGWGHFKDHLGSAIYATVDHLVWGGQALLILKHLKW